MKRLLKCLLTAVTSTTLTTTVTACSGYDFNGGGITPTPPPPIPKDIEYYQKSIQDSENIVNDFINNINELAKYKNDKDIFPTLEDYTRTIAELKAEQASYQATIYDCQYQILYLQANGTFNPQQKAQAIIALQNQIIQLNQELATKKQYIADYDKSELVTIETQITIVQTILTNLLKP